MTLSVVVVTANKRLLLAAGPGTVAYVVRRMLPTGPTPLDTCSHTVVPKMVANHRLDAEIAFTVVAQVVHKIKACAQTRQLSKEGLVNTTSTGSTRFSRQEAHPYVVGSLIILYLST